MPNRSSISSTRTERAGAERPGTAAARYYDLNTAAFLRFGGGAASGSIHRQLWGPGVDTVSAAADFVNVLLGEAIEQSVEDAGRASAGTPRAVVLDLGCGVGGTLRALATRFPGLACHGVTISERQASLARQWNADTGLADRCDIMAADFESVRIDIEADFVIAIESYVHSRSARRFFDTVVAHLRPGGRLFLVDDFVRDDSGVAAETLAARFRAGWRAPAFGTVAQCARDAGAAGLELAANRDLSPLIRLDRPRDRAIALVAPVIAWLRLGRLPAHGSLIGGAALNRGLRDEVFGYRWLEFVRPAARPARSTGARA